MVVMVESALIVAGVLDTIEERGQLVDVQDDLQHCEQTSGYLPKVCSEARGKEMISILRRVSKGFRQEKIQSAVLGTSLAPTL